LTEEDFPTRRPTVLRVDLGALAHNVKILKAAAPGCSLLAVVKADAYGTGAIPVSRAALRAGADALGVALAEEGAALRRSGINAPILLLSPVDPEQAEDLLRWRLTPSVYSLAFLRALEGAAERLEAQAQVHLKVDSGMGRAGFRPEEIPALVAELGKCRRIRVAGLYSNLASADDPACPQTAAQLETFLRILGTLEREGICPSVVHLANSAGLLAHPSTRLRQVRPGLTLFGLRPSTEVPDPGLRPVLSLSTRLLQLKEMPPGSPVGYGATFVTSRPTRLGILPVGYADGLPRSLGNRGEVLVRGRRCPLVGRVSMDLCAADLTGVDGVREGEEVVLWGGEGPSRLDPWDWARWAGTIPYEILTGLSPRLHRLYASPGGLGEGEAEASSSSPAATS